MLPGPLAVATAILEEARSGELFLHLGATLARVVIAFLIAMVIGCALGLVFGQLAEVVVKPVRGTSIKARPECRLTDGGAASDNH